MTRQAHPAIAEVAGSVARWGGGRGLPVGLLDTNLDLEMNAWR